MVEYDNYDYISVCVCVCVFERACVHIYLCRPYLLNETFWNIMELRPWVSVSLRSLFHITISFFFYVFCWHISPWKSAFVSSGRVSEGFLLNFHQKGVYVFISICVSYLPCIISLASYLSMLGECASGLLRKAMDN